MQAAGPILDAEDVERYRGDGVLVVRNAVTGDELRRLQDAGDRLTEAAVAYGRELDAARPIRLDDDHGFTEWDELDERNFLYGRGADGERVWRRAEEMWSRDAIFRVVSVNPRVLGVVRAILGPVVVPANSAMVVKMPGAGAAVPWHRDPHDETGPPETRDGAGDFVCDVYLDHSTVGNGCLWAIPGSHRGEKRDVDPLDFNVEGAVPLEVGPGDMILHSTGVLHGSPQNRSAEQRRTLYLHYRTPAALAAAGHPEDWVRGRAALLDEMVRERAASGLDAPS